MKIEKTEVKITMSMEDLNEAVVDFITKKGGDASGKLKIEKKELREEYQVGMFDCDYRYHFDGLNIILEK